MVHVNVQIASSIVTHWTNNVALWVMMCTCLNCCLTHYGQMIEIDTAEQKIYFFIPQIFLPYQNLAPTLSTIQLSH